jgi:hypothetical protein
VILVDISSINVTCHGRPWNNDDFTLIERFPSEEFYFTIGPVDFDRADDFSITLESSDPDVFEVTEILTAQADIYGFQATWTGRGRGTLRVIVINNGIEIEWSVRVHSS